MGKIHSAFLTTVLALLIVPSLPRAALACGGCFHGMQDMESTQVTSHRMVLSVSPQQTTLWDQVEYVGSPADFAWVLPIHGTVNVGISSDLFFATLDGATVVTPESPLYQCQTPPTSGGSFGTCSKSAASTGTGFGGGSSESEPVTILQQSAVGPYETVQLSSTDPTALRDWLSSHGYVVPAAVGPTIDAYVSEGFDFLAVRLAPGNGVQAMQPIRVTFPGASTSLPLRMVSAGTGATTAITLWVIGEGRYTTTNMPTFTISESELIWDWTAHRSNYSELVAGGVAANGGATWLVASALPESQMLFDKVVAETATNPQASGYGGSDPVAAAQADEAAAIGSIAPNHLFVTRLYAELSRAALGADLTVGASTSTAILPQTLVAQQTTGTPPCTLLDECTSGVGGPGTQNTGGANTVGLTGNGSSGCAVTRESDRGFDAIAIFGLAGAALALARRRPRADHL